MKKTHMTAICTSLAVLTSFSGCGNSQADDTAQTGEVFVAVTEADFEEIASTLTELIDASDFIAEIRVAETNTCVYEGNDAIFTEITPDILEIYQGTYADETLVVEGGYLPMSTYYAALEAQDDYAEEVVDGFDTSGYTDEQLDAALVYWDFCGNYIPQEGDILLFFGTYDDYGNYRVTYDYQGEFVLTEEDTWHNQALSTEETDREPLVEALLQLSGAELVASASTISRTIDGNVYDLQQSIDDDTISIPVDALLTQIKENA